MTGQVKEEILTRFGELGLRVVGGSILLAPGLLPAAVVLPAGSGGRGRFSFCGVEFVLCEGPANQFRIRRSGVWSEAAPGLKLPRQLSTEVMSRTGTIEVIEFLVADWPEF